MEKGDRVAAVKTLGLWDVQTHWLDTQSWLAVGCITLLDSLWYQWQGTHSSRVYGHLGRASFSSIGTRVPDIHWAVFNVCTFTEARVKAAGNIPTICHSDWTVVSLRGHTKERGTLSSSQYIFLIFYISSSSPLDILEAAFTYVHGTHVQGFGLFVFSFTVLHLSKCTDFCYCVSSLPSLYLLKGTNIASVRTYKFPCLFKKRHAFLVFIMWIGVRTCACDIVHRAQRHWIHCSWKCPRWVLGAKRVSFATSESSLQFQLPYFIDHF